MLFRLVALIFSTTLVFASVIENGTSSAANLLERIQGPGITSPSFATYPWMVAIFRNTNPPPTGTGTLAYYATGVAVNRYWVLTSGEAANYARVNVASDVILVKFGSGDISATCTACQTRKVKKGIQYPTYIGPSLVSNIGVIKVCPSFPTMIYAPLPATPPTISTGMSGTSLGWQASQAALRAMDQAVEADATCSTTLSAAVAAGDPWEANNFCTSVTGRGTCGPDRGGPFVMNNNVVAVLDAVSCRSATHTDTYTKLDAAYLTWISNNTPA